MRYKLLIPLVLSFSLAHAGEKSVMLLDEAFEENADKWEPKDATAWQLSEEKDGSKVFELTKDKTNYKPAQRSPVNLCLLKDIAAGDFTLTARVMTTKASYGHRDLCFFFGYQDDSHFYYAHLGEKTDDHANQIFIVNAADRAKISTKTTQGTPWKEETWHQIKIVRDTEAGTIHVYFDDMEHPAMEATDKTFTWGGFGIGSFDDKGKFDDIKIVGIKAEAPKKEEKPEPKE